MATNIDPLSIAAHRNYMDEMMAQMQRDYQRGLSEQAVGGPKWVSPYAAGSRGLGVYFNPQMASGQYAQPGSQEAIGLKAAGYQEGLPTPGPWSQPGYGVLPNAAALGVGGSQPGLSDVMGATPAMSAARGLPSAVPNDTPAFKPGTDGPYPGFTMMGGMMVPQTTEQWRAMWNDPKYYPHGGGPQGTPVAPMTPRPTQWGGLGWDPSTFKLAFPNAPISPLPQKAVSTLTPSLSSVLQRRP